MLTKAEKSEFISDLIDNVHAQLLNGLDRVPEDWDGHELRQWIADAFASQVLASAMKGKRMKAYDAAVIERNL